LVAIVVIAALMILGPILGNTFSTINQSLQSV
jgi:Flp pilus assembly pilin Flp